ncbi:MAG: TonB-dependent receptor [Cytophagales bacterium]|nr:TonB-dependent receptor [Cytophagales bacterium]
MFSRLLFLSLLCEVLYAGLLYAQVKLRVIDAETRLPLSGTEVRSTQQKTFGDNYGNVSLSLRKGDTVQVLRKGYDTLFWIAPASVGNFTIPLSASYRLLSELLITGLEANAPALQVPAAIAVLSKQDLQRDNNTIVAPALNRIPGVFMHNGTLNTNRLTIRGIGSRSSFSTNKIRAYFNEIPLTTGDGETTIEDIDLSTIERIEVIKGPSSSIYGAGLGGTLLLSAARADFKKSEIGSEYMAGSFGLQRVLNYLQSGNENTNLRFVHSYQEMEGFRENSAYFRRLTMLHGQFYASEKTDISLLANHINVKAYIPSSIDEATFRTNPRAAAANWMQLRGYEAYQKVLAGTSVNHRFTNHWELAGSIFLHQRINDEPRPFNFLREIAQASGARSKLQYHFTHAERWQLKALIGTEFYGEFYKWHTYRNNSGRQGAMLSDNEERRRYLNLFLHAEATWRKRTTFIAGINLNQTVYEYIDLFRANGRDLSGSRHFGAVFSPRFAINYIFANQQAFFINISHGFSPPTLAETLTPAGQINPQIRPETGMNYEIGFRGNWRNLQYDISTYAMDIRNLLVARRTSEDAFVGVNAGRTLHTGLEVGLQHTLLTKHRRRPVLQTFASYTYAPYRFVEFTDLDKDYSGNPLTGVPRHTFAGGLDWQTENGLYASVNLQAVSSMSMRDDNALRSGAYQTVNCRVGYRCTFLKHLSIHLYGGVSNLTNEHYAGMILVNAIGNPPRYYYPAAPRNFFGGMAFGWKW